MGETQVIFRVDEQMLRKLDSTIEVSGFKTRNEWFRNAVRAFLEDMERRNVIRELRKLTVKGMTEEDIVKMVNEWRRNGKAGK